MMIYCPSAHFNAIYTGRCTADLFGSGNLVFEPNDRIQYHELDATGKPTGRTVSVVVTDVQPIAGSVLLSIRRLQDALSVSVPNGTIAVTADSSDVHEEGYPGMGLFINDQLAAVVEWHPDYRSFVIRTYNDHDDEPQHYHRWDGTPLES